MESRVRLQEATPLWPFALDLQGRRSTRLMHAQRYKVLKRPLAKTAKEASKPCEGMNKEERIKNKDQKEQKRIEIKKDKATNGERAKERERERERDT